MNARQPPKQSLAEVGAVTVLVPSYNHAPYVERCLRSVMQQTMAPSKLLVIDDGSSDGSVNVIERALQDCPFPSELIVRKNKGLCATLNEGLARTSGEYFAYLGSDDIWLPDFLAARVSLLHKLPKTVLAYGHAYVIDKDDRIIDCSTNWPNSQFREGDQRGRLFRGMSLMSPTVLYRRAKLAPHRWNELAKLEDYELYLRIAQDGDFAFDECPLSAWRLHTYNTSGDLLLMMREVLEAQARVLPELGMTRREIARVARMTKFHYVEDLVRHGRRGAALRLFSGNFQSAVSFHQLIRNATRLLVPQVILRARSQFLQARFVDRYASVELYRTSQSPHAANATSKANDAVKYGQVSSWAKSTVANDSAPLLAAAFSEMRPGAARIALGKPVKIHPATAEVFPNLKEAWERRELVFMLIHRELKIRYKQTFLGAAWVIAQPLMTTLLFTFVFGRVAHLATDAVPYPLYVFSGMVIWNFVNQSINGAANSIVNNTNLVTKIYFPRLIIPLAPIGAALLDLGLNLIVLVSLMAYYRILPSAKLLWLPGFLALTVLLATGIGAWFSALNVKYRDVKQLVPFALQFWMFASPIFYQTDLLPPRWNWVMALNPLTGIIEGCRMAMLGRPPDGTAMLLGIVLTLTVFLLGIHFFQTAQDEFSDVI